ncbi:MAG TPA: hypothetical protein VF483_00845 [Gemmatimonadaceae bacterium]
MAESAVRTWDAWCARDDAETEVWYRFRDLREGVPRPETVAALADAKDLAEREAIFTRSLRVPR